ncbi:hypothetical protein ABUW04_33255 [Streptacidiphilus sp. N1-10]|uniref:Uncharacterized protein n=1 Tax=Streptacidiphilus jeojiensis TaxID=3229225 RepID=A0ABV6XXW6_9ACTN
MPSRNDSSSNASCSGIACIVNAVRAGDDLRIDRLLIRFVEAADLAGLFALRAALAEESLGRHASGLPCEHT